MTAPVSGATGASLLSEAGIDRIKQDHRARFDLSSGKVSYEDVALTKGILGPVVDTGLEHPMDIEFVGSKGTLRLKGSTLVAQAYPGSGQVEVFEVYRGFASSADLADQLEQDAAAIGLTSPDGVDPHTVGDDLETVLADLRAHPDAENTARTQGGTALGLLCWIEVRVPKDKPGRTLVYSVIPSDVAAKLPKL